MKNLLFLFLIALISFYFFSSTKNLVEEKKTFTSKEISFSFVGDLMCHSPIYENSKVKKDSFDFNPIFEEIKNYLSQADFTIGNLETVVAGNEFSFSGYPNFNSPIEYLTALKNAGFDVLINANNHSLDRGIVGAIKTIENIERNGLLHIGTAKNEIERDSILILEKNEIKVGLLAYTYGLNGNNLPKSKKFLINIIDTTLIKKDISKAKPKVDVVIVYLHFGEEYQRVPNKFQVELANQIFSFGADVIIASHPHVIQPIEIMNDKNFVAYSLGNFLSNQRWRYSDSGMILNFTFEKNDSNKIRVKNLSVTPTWVYKGTINKQTQFRIIKADTSNYPKYFSAIDKLKMKQSFLDTKKIFEGIEVQ